MEPVWTAVSGVSVSMCCPSFHACMVQRFVVKVWLLSHKRVPTLSNLSPCSWYLILFEDKQGSKSGGIDIWCFWHILTMFYKVFLSLYRVLLVLSESLQVWRRIGKKKNHLEQKRQKRVQIGDFTQNSLKWLFRSSGATRACSCGARFLRKFPNI